MAGLLEFSVGTVSGSLSVDVQLKLLQSFRKSLDGLLSALRVSRRQEVQDCALKYVKKRQSSHFIICELE